MSSVQGRRMLACRSWRLHAAGIAFQWILRSAASTSDGETAAKSRLYPVTAHSGNKMTSAPALADEWMASVIQETLSTVAARNFICAAATTSWVVFISGLECGLRDGFVRPSMPTQSALQSVTMIGVQMTVLRPARSTAATRSRYSPGRLSSNARETSDFAPVVTMRGFNPGGVSAR